MSQGPTADRQTDRQTDRGESPCSAGESGAHRRPAPSHVSRPCGRQLTDSTTLLPASSVLFLLSSSSSVFSSFFFFFVFFFFFFLFFCLFFNLRSGSPSVSPYLLIPLSFCLRLSVWFCFLCLSLSAPLTPSLCLLSLFLSLTLSLSLPYRLAGR